MASVYKGLVIQIGADTSKLDTALNRAKRSAGSAASEIKKLDKALKIDPGNVNHLASQQEQYKKAIAATEDELKALKTAEEQIGRENMSTEQWTKLQSDISLAEGRLEDYNRALKKLQTEQAAANTKLGQAGTRLQEIGEKASAAGQKMESVGRAMTLGVTVPIVAGAGAAVKAATDLDTSLTNVKKTVDGSAEDYERLKDAAIEFSKVNAVSASELLDIEALGAQLGFTLDKFENGKTQVQEFGEVVSGLDIATNMSAEQAGTELAQFFNIMSENKAMASNYASAIVGLGNSFATTESDISAMAMRIAGAGKSIGLSSADVLGLSTALTSLGINAEAGGTAISTVMSSIDASVATNDKNLATWAKTAHMTVEEFSDAWGTDAVGALDAVLKGMAADVEEGGNLSVILDELGISSLRQTDMMKRLANSGDLMSNAVAKANQEWDANNALSNEVANRNDSLAAKFEMLRNRVVAVATEIGEPLADALFELIDAAEPLFQAIENGARTFADMSDGEQQAIIQTVALIAAIGPALSLFGKVTRSITIVGRAFTAMSRILTRTKAGFTSFSGTLKTVNVQSKNLVASTKQAGGSMTTLGAKARLGTTALRATAAASKVARVSMMALGTVGVMLAVTAIAELVNLLGELNEKQQNLAKATTGLDTAISSLGAKAETGAKGVDGLSDAIDDYRLNLDEVIEKQAEFADSVAEDFASTNRQAGSLDYFAKTIADLAGNVGNNPEKLAELKAALAGYNEIAGTTYSVIDEANGTLSVSTEELIRNADAWQKNAYAQAASSKMVEAQERLIDAEMARKQAAEDVANAEKAMNEATNNYAKTSAMAAKEAAEARLTQANATYDAAESGMRRLQEITGEYQSEYDKATGSALQPIIQQSELLNTTLEEMGLPLETAAGRLAQLGYTAEDVAGMTAEQFAVMASSTGTSIGDMVAAAESLGIDLPPAIRQAVEQADAICGVGGAGIVREFIAGMDLHQYEAILKAQEISGKTADELLSAAAEAGVSGQEQIDKYIEGIESGMDPAAAAAAAVGKNASDSLGQNSDGGSAGKQVGEGFKSAIDVGAGIAKAAQMAKNAVDAGKRNSNGTPIGANLSGTAPAGINTSAMNPKASLMGSNAVAAGLGAVAGADKIGRDFSQGAANGIDENAMVAKAQRLGLKALDALAKAIESNSPSKAAMRIGGYFSEGAALGIEDGIPDVEKASEEMAKAAMRSAQMSAPNLAGSYDASSAARQMASAMRLASGPVYNLTIDGMTVNDDPAIQSAVMTIIDSAMVSATARRRA